MRTLVYILSTLAVMGLAFWAYQENYRTQQSQRRVDSLHRQIGEAREAIGVLRAEWAYLNRPERLRELADLNYERLNLLPLGAEHFAEVEQVAYPKLFELDVSASVDVSAPPAATDAPAAPAPAPARASDGAFP
jgi:hypothetical protein